MLAGLRQEAVACLAANDVRTVASERCALHPLPPGLPAPNLALNNFDHEDAETQYEDDEPPNDAWQAVFDNGDEVQMSALRPRLGAISVHKGHRMFHHWGVVVTCGEIQHVG